MTIRFDESLNKEIRRKVDAFNKRLKRAEKNNLNYLPSKQSVKEIKESFAGSSAKRTELKKLLKELDSFNVKSASQIVKLDSGEKTNIYQLNLAKKHQRRLRNAIDEEIREQEEFVDNKPQFIMRRSRLNLLKNIKESLLAKIRSRDAIRSINAQYNRNYSSERLDNFYDEFFEVFEKETEFIGYDQEKMNYIKKRLQDVSPETLIKIRNNSPHVKTILDRFDSDENYNAQDVDALEATYDYLYQNIDNIIEEFTEDYEVL